MDTPLHALAVPGADRSALKRPEQAAIEIADLIEARIEPGSARRAGAVPEAVPR
jgi:hypothetical protein